ncbi:MAG: hypothetical protein CL912_27410 [Deltaproteobacteria bacterium]|nr:hypothetical protein [Deltaproteobacteria bacterium]
MSSEDQRLDRFLLAGTCQRRYSEDKQINANARNARLLIVAFQFQENVASEWNKGMILKIRKPTVV